MNTILTIDVGPARCRASYVDREGTVLAAAEGAYLTGVIGDWVEQEPRDWWFQMVFAIAELRKKAPDVKPAAITLTGQPRLLILADDNDRLHAALMPADRRSSREWQEMVDGVGIDSLLTSASNLHDTTSHIARLLWLKKHQPTNYGKAKVIFLAAHEYLTWRLCGARVTDYTSASLTDLFSIPANGWAFELLNRFELRTDWFPQIVKAGTQAGVLFASMAEILDIPKSLPVIHGTADLMSSYIGSGAALPSQYVCYLGDSGWLGAAGLPEPGDAITGLVNMRDATGERNMTIGPMVTAGGNFEWLKDRFGPAEDKLFEEDKLSTTDLLMTLAAEAPVGSGGVIYLPYLSGEQAPFHDPNARSGWLFVSRRTWRSELYRAVLEGVAYSLRAIQLLLPEPSDEGEVELKLIGNDYCTPLWAQIFADVFDCRVELLSPADDVAARGAAFLAGRSLGWHRMDAPPSSFTRPASTCTPNVRNVEIYERMFGIFYKLYPALHSAFAEAAGSAA